MGRKPKTAAKPAAKTAAKAAAKVARTTAKAAGQKKIIQREYDAFIAALAGVGKRCVVSVTVDGTTITIPDALCAEIYQVVVNAHRSIVA